jgi:hypothetical protein
VLEHLLNLRSTTALLDSNMSNNLTPLQEAYQTLLEGLTLTAKLERDFADITQRDVDLMKQDVRTRRVNRRVNQSVILDNISHRLMTYMSKYLDMGRSRDRLETQFLDLAVEAFATERRIVRSRLHVHGELAVDAMFVRIRMYEIQSGKSLVEWNIIPSRPT